MNPQVTVTGTFYGDSAGRGMVADGGTHAG